MSRFQRTRIVRIAAVVLVVLVLVYKYSSAGDTSTSSITGSSSDHKANGGSEQLSPDYQKQDTSSSSHGGEHHETSSSDSLTSSHEGTSAKPESTIPGQYERESATFVSLVRNSDLSEIVKSIRIIEDRFNHNYHYDWVFLNDKEFDEKFKTLTTALVSGKTHYGVISSEQWGYPDFIDQDKAAAARKQMAQDGIIYGDSVSYRHMCRYESGFFFRHELMQPYQYYWRVEPSIDISCDVPIDIFKFMRTKNIKYGFTISLPEYPATIATLWQTVKNFTKLHPEYVAKDNLIDWLSYDHGETYNGCHFWSNFEVANLDIWRSEAYLKFFDFLDKAGGFFYERWGDAPVHSIAAGLFLNKNEVHHFENIGYFHPPFTNCPTNEEARLDLKCVCLPTENFAWKGYSCTSRFYDIRGLQRPTEWKSQSD